MLQSQLVALKTIYPMQIQLSYLEHFFFFCNMENSLKVQMVERLCTQTVKLVRVETMLWVLKLQLVWCLRGPRGSSTTTAPDGLRRHRCSTRAVTSHLPALMAIAKNCTSRWEKNKVKSRIFSNYKCWSGAVAHSKNLVWWGFEGKICVACPGRDPPSIDLPLDKSSWNSRAFCVNRVFKNSTAVLTQSFFVVADHSFHHSRHSHAACENRWSVASSPLVAVATSWGSTGPFKSFKWIIIGVVTSVHGHR